ncbi:MAG: hypothetical protein ACOY4I_02190 [Bacillota bacterium]
MYGELFGSMSWALLMLLHMMMPVLIIILAVALGDGLWNRVRIKSAFSSRMQDSIKDTPGER